MLSCRYEPPAYYEDMKPPIRQHTSRNPQVSGP